MNKRDFNVVGNEGTDNQELAKGMESAIRSAFVGIGVNGIPLIININIIGC